MGTRNRDIVQHKVNRRDKIPLELRRYFFMKKSFFKFTNVTTILGYFSMIFASAIANGRCCAIFHEPQKPEDLSKLRRF
mgnify:CR=1 FL=1